MTMNCDVCGTKINDESGVCGSCGNTINSATTITFSIDSEDENKQDVVVYPKEFAQLVVVKGPNVGDSYLIDDSDISVGRDPLSEIFLNDVTVSRKHAVIEAKGSNYSLTDAGSLNGTYVNGKRLEKAVLRNGDQLQIGKFKLLFVGGK